MPRWDLPHTMLMRLITDIRSFRRLTSWSWRANGDRSMSTPASSTLRSGSPARLPAEVEQLLLDVVADGFILCCCGPRFAPHALVACYHWQHYVDVITIRHFDRIITARIPAPPSTRIDVFNPTVVVWAYEGPPQPALRALLNLLPPHHPHAPTCTYPAPPILHISRAEQRPMTIQIPPPPRVAHRATRLAATMANTG